MIVPYIRNDHYDSLLDTSGVTTTTNANIYVIIKVFMEQYRVTGGSGTIQDVGGTTVTVVNWASQAEFTTFCQNFKQAAENTWNNQLWMIPSGNWGADFVAHRPNVRCCMSIRLESSRSNAHLVLRCLKLNQLQGYRPHMDRVAHHGEISSFDVQSLSTLGFSGMTSTQVRSAHEIGHYLGLGHVNNAGCSTGTSTNAVLCYGGSAHQFGDIMGGGSRVDVWHVRPWRNRINRHLRNITPPRWTVTRQRPAPRWAGRQAELILP